MKSAKKTKSSKTAFSRAYSLWLGPPKENIYRELRQKLKQMRVRVLICNLESDSQVLIEKIQTIDHGFQIKMAMGLRNDLGLMAHLRNDLGFDLIVKPGTSDKDVIDLVLKRAEIIVADRVSQNNKLNRLVGELERTESLESFFSVLHDEITDSKTLSPSYSDAYLLINNGNASEILYHSQVSMRVMRVGANELFSLLKDNADVDLARRALADVVSRPISRLQTLLKESYSYDGTSISVMLLGETRRSAYQETSGESLLKSNLKKVFDLLPKLYMKDVLLRNISIWRDAFDHIDQPVVVLNEQYQVLRANSTFSSHGKKGLCFEQFAGRSTPCEGCPIQDPSSQSINNHQNKYEVVASPITSAGSNRYFVHHYIDVSERDKLHARLVQSEKMVAIGKLVGNIAHELNNPLSGISSMADVLAEEMHSNSLKDDLEMISEAAKRSSKIVLDLLKYIDESSTVSLSVVNLNEVVKSALQLIASMLRGRDYQIDLSESEIWIEANFQLMQQVVINLVSNAVHATDEGMQIVVSTSVKGNRVTLSVADNGKGIPKDDLNKIFEPFFTTKPLGTGTGLGLAFCKNIVIEFGGEIEIKSEIGVGTEFKIHLPLYIARDKGM